MKPAPRLRLLAPVIGALLPSGCFIRAARMESKLKPWVGKDIRAAVSEFGPPTQTFENGPAMVVSWSSAGPTVMTTNAYARRNNATAYSTAVPTSCQFWFDVTREGVITAWHWKGQC